MNHSLSLCDLPIYILYRGAYAATSYESETGWVLSVPGVTELKKMRL